MRIAILFGLMMLAGVGLALPQEQTQFAACDNADRPDTKTRAHKCQCARATQECKDGEPNPDMEMEPGSMCKAGYCKPDHCECVGKGCS